MMTMTLALDLPNQPTTKLLPRISTSEAKTWINLQRVPLSLALSFMNLMPVINLLRIILTVAQSLMIKEAVINPQKATRILPTLLMRNQTKTKALAATIILPMIKDNKTPMIINNKSNLTSNKAMMIKEAMTISNNNMTMATKATIKADMIINKAMTMVINKAMTKEAMIKAVMITRVMMKIKDIMRSPFLPLVCQRLEANHMTRRRKQLRSGLKQNKRSYILEPVCKYRGVFLFVCK